MPTPNFRKPQLPSHYYVLLEPPDSAGEEVLHFISERRKIKLKGRSFREFQQRVMPLLDGRHTLEEIEADVADIFPPEDLEAGLRLLAEHNLLKDADGAAAADPVLEPQLNFFHEVSADPDEIQGKLAGATVTVVGLGGSGASVALSLAATRVGTVRCIDPLPVAPADVYLCGPFSLADVGVPRMEAVRRRMEAVAPAVKTASHAGALDSDADIGAAIRGSDLVICCADPGQSWLIYKLNRACLQERIRWTSCSASGMEVVIGPTVHPFESACYLCYKMRAVGCAENPEDEFAFQRFLDRRKRDDSGRRENLVFANGIAAHLLGLEALKEITGLMPSSTVGRVVVVDLIELTMKKHLVLRKPWCPACFANET